MIEVAIESVLTNPLALAAWIFLDAIAVAILAHDLETTSAGLAPHSKLVWLLTVLYSGPLGLVVYWYSGRPSNARDTAWRRGVRSTAHCYASCGAAVVLGVAVAVEILALNTTAVAGVTFVGRYVFGTTRSVRSLAEGGVGVRDALVETIPSETPSIATMMLVAVGGYLWLAGEATIGEPLFWSALVVSLSGGYVAAFPVNVALVRAGVKEGVQNPNVPTRTGA